ncbi:aldo/keto reductase [Streptomyces avicenniae]|uniref:aldo/keto reductase n=1 Tax=Streptomyces avicenniae TaxID=500153 RepID=UPI00069964D3|nr:aldo/keto reductase [Streptomyces avicenniae]
MRYRTLGADGPRVSAVGFGAMTLSPGIYGDVTEDAATGALLAALDAGTTLVDTADIYGAGHGERLIGRVLAGGRRDTVVLATKFGGDTGPDGRLVPGLGRRAHVRAAVEASLGRLATDRIDLYYLHRLDPTTPVEETVAALAELVAEGKIRHVGLSEVSAGTLRRAVAVHPVAAVQSEYSLLSRAPEGGILPVCDALGVAFVAYSPLGRGLIGGTVRAQRPGGNDWRRGNPRFQRGNLAANLSLADGVAALAAEAGVTPAQLALAWVIARGALPIPGTRGAAHATANARAADVEIADDVLGRLELLLPAGAAAGAAADDAYLANLDAS